MVVKAAEAETDDRSVLETAEAVAGDSLVVVKATKAVADDKSSDENS